MSQKQDIEFLETYRQKIKEYREACIELDPSEFYTPERYLAEVPTKKQQEEELKRRGKFSSNPNKRSEWAAKLVKVKRKIAKREVEQSKKLSPDVKRVAQLAREVGIDGKMFFKPRDDYSPTEMIKPLSEQIATIGCIIAETEKPADNSTIPEGAELLTVSQVARLTGWAESVVRQRNKQGLLPKPVRFGGTIQWIRKDFIAWIEAGCPSRQKWELQKQGKEI
jgi:predicted DNA-binding transcriptional regulator AlpA